MADFLPRRECSLLAWSRNFRDVILAAPEDYGLSQQDADDYAENHDRFAQAMAVISDNSTRTSSAVFAKDTARDELKTMARMLAKIVKATPSVTAQQRFNLGLSVHNGSGSVIGPPQDEPILSVLSVDGFTATLLLKDKESFGRSAKPRRVAGATIFSHVGKTAPNQFRDWQFECNTTETKVQITFPSTLPDGSQVWFTARWMNPRLEYGPCAAPRNTWLSHPLPMPVARPLAA